MPDTSESETLFATVKPYRLRLAFTYGVTLLENVFEVLYPFTLGIAINGLIAGEGWQAVMPFAAIWFAHIVTATFRQMYDTRLFARIYAHVASNFIVRQRRGGTSTSEVAARSAMAREAIDFFEWEIPASVTAIIGLFGGIIMLFFYDTLSGAAMATVMVPIFLLYFLYGRKSLQLTEKLNNRQEREVLAIEDAGRKRVSMHFKALAKWRVFLSDAQAKTWGLADVFLFAAIMFILFRLTSDPGVRAGDVFAGLAYALNVSTALDEAPIVVEQFSRLVDIRRRVDQGGSEE